MKESRTIYEKLVQMAKEEADGREQVNIKELCNSIATRFRLTNREIYRAMREMNDVSETKFGEVGKISFTFARK